MIGTKREVCVWGVELEVSKKLPQEGSLAKECLASRLYFVCTCVREHACAECPALTHVMCVRPNHASGVTRSRSSVSIKGGKGATFKSETIFRNAVVRSNTTPAKSPLGAPPPRPSAKALLSLHVTAVQLYSLLEYTQYSTLYARR